MKEHYMTLVFMFYTHLNITDPVDMMRAEILCMEICAYNHTLQSIKETAAYMGCHYDIPFSDAFLRQLLAYKREIEGVDFPSPDEQSLDKIIPPCEA